MYVLRLGLVIVVTCAPVPALSDGGSHIGSRHVLLAYASNADAPVERIDLYVTRDGGKSWQPASFQPHSSRALLFEAEEDGWHGFYLVLHNSSGASGPPPEPGAEPHVRVTIDTTAPTLQLHAAAGMTQITPGALLTLRLSLIDEHLGEQGVRVYYRTGAGEHWTDGGLAEASETEITWTTPDVLTGPVDLRIIATDRAGNRAMDELHGLSLKPTEPASTPEPPADARSETPDDRPAQPERAPTEAKAATTQPAAPPEADHLRELAARFMSQRRYDLAAARLSDALEHSPRDADLLVDLGSAFYYSKRYDDAEDQYRSALDAVPNHTGALEGLALVAATEKRYPDAQAHLLRLLELQPGSDITWLRYGDIEHKLGQRSKALEAWEHALGLESVSDKVRQAARKRLEHFGPQRAQPDQ